MTKKKKNRLAGEKSPYLRQHSENPVDWYSWSEEALARAVKEDKPMLVSIGYSSCHWCHVMERESFEDAETARVMNENFINIKVDREEHPQLDSLYMKAVQAMTGHAGWPLNVFTTPDGTPFYGGTYFPPEDGLGLPSFKKVLLSISRAYRDNKDRIGSLTEDLVRDLKHTPPSAPVELKPKISDNAFEAGKLFFDPLYGGFGMGAKFPHAMYMKFLIRYYMRMGSAEAFSVIKKTLSEMASGGIYDHLGGGFHRYTVDEKWEVPHFEKMLYDNALLSEVFTLAFEITGLDLYRDTAVETLEYLLRDMRSPEGGFYSAEDADVEGVEGEYYVWTCDEVKESLGEEEARRFIEYFSMTGEGNFEGKNTLRIDPAQKGPEEAVSEDIKALKRKLLEVRRKRRAPSKDRKVITAWNALAITALALASRAFKREDFLDEATRCADFILKEVRDKDRRLVRYHLDGAAEAKAALEDHALLGSALVSIYEVSGEGRWLEEAVKLAKVMKGLFWEDGLFFDTGRDQEKLFVRERDLYDNDIPSGNSAAAGFLLQLFVHTSEEKYRGLSERTLASIEGMKDEPLSYGNALCVLEGFLREGAGEAEGPEET